MRIVLIADFRKIKMFGDKKNETLGYQTFLEGIKLQGIYLEKNYKGES